MHGKRVHVRAHDEWSSSVLGVEFVWDVRKSWVYRRRGDCEYVRPFSADRRGRRDASFVRHYARVRYGEWHVALLGVFKSRSSRRSARYICSVRDAISYRHHGHGHGSGYGGRWMEHVFNSSEYERRVENVVLGRQRLWPNPARRDSFASRNQVPSRDGLLCDLPGPIQWRPRQGVGNPRNQHLNGSSSKRDRHNAPRMYATRPDHVRNAKVRLLCMFQRSNLVRIATR